MATRSLSSRWTAIVVALGLALLPVAGCGPEDGDPGESEDAGGLEGFVTEAWQRAGDAASGVWVKVSETTSEGVVFVGRVASDGAAAVGRGAEATWVWTAGAAGDGWDWVRTQADAGVTWVEDRAGGFWALARDSSQAATLWVKVTAGGGAAWVRTALPDAWRIAGDAAGRMLIWIESQPVPLAVAASAIAVIVTTFWLGPKAGAFALARGGVLHAARLLGDLYAEEKDGLEGLSEAQFVALGQGIAPSADDGLRILRKVTEAGR